MHAKVTTAVFDIFFVLRSQLSMSLVSQSIKNQEFKIHDIRTRRTDGQDMEMLNWHFTFSSIWSGPLFLSSSNATDLTTCTSRGSSQAKGSRQGSWYSWGFTTKDGYHKFRYIPLSWPQYVTVSGSWVWPTAAQLAFGLADSRGTVESLAHSHHKRWI